MQLKKVESEKNTREKDREIILQKLAHQREKDKELVRGKFVFHEVPGGTLPFTILLYKGDSPTNYEFRDGEIVKIPLGVAKHLNKSGWYPEYSYVTDADHKTMAKVTKRIRRYSFQSLEFMDDEGIGSDDVPFATAGS